MEKKIIEVVKTVGMLKRMPRMGWLYIGIPKDMVESVAEHSFRVAFITMILCDKLKEKYSNLDCLKAIKMSVLHDVPESTFMDVGGEARDILGKETQSRAETEGMKRVLSDLPEKYREEYYSLWLEYEKQNSLESKIVRIADKLEMFIQAYEYCKLGIKKDLFQEFLDELTAFVSKLEKESPLKELTGMLVELKEMFENID